MVSAYNGITLALSKGRIFEETVPLLAAANIVPAENPESSRKLIIGTNRPEVRLVIVRASDTPTYVQYGAADLGIAGKDVLIEAIRNYFKGMRNLPLLYEYMDALRVRNIIHPYLEAMA